MIFPIRQWRPYVQEIILISSVTFTIDDLFIWLCYNNYYCVCCFYDHLSCWSVGMLRQQLWKINFLLAITGTRANILKNNCHLDLTCFCVVIFKFNDCVVWLEKIRRVTLYLEEIMQVYYQNVRSSIVIKWRTFCTDVKSSRGDRGQLKHVTIVTRRILAVLLIKRQPCLHRACATWICILCAKTNMTRPRNRLLSCKNTFSCT